MVKEKFEKVEKAFEKMCDAYDETESIREVLTEMEEKHLAYMKRQRKYAWISIAVVFSCFIAGVIWVLLS